ncbi:MAG: hypothetical protein ABI613_07205 [Gemmatimonadota bacterium]
MSLSPISNRIGIGVESYVIFEGDGEDGEGDLYAGSASGGTAYQLTFSRAHESSPALSPDGAVLAFIRGRTRQDSSSYRVWIMNLLNGSERELPALPANAHLERLAWSADSRTLYLRTSAGDVSTPAPPAGPALLPVPAESSAVADSALEVMLGESRQARLIPCAGEAGICVAVDSGAPQNISTQGAGAFRWGSDSVAFWLGDAIEIRPLGGGTTRTLRWKGLPAHPGAATHFRGRPEEVTPPAYR